MIIKYIKIKNETRLKNNKYHNKKIQSQSQPASTIGDIVHLRKKHQDKHQLRDTFIVTDQIDDKINIQKILNAQNEKAMQLRPKSYLVSPQSVYTAKSFPSQYTSSQQERNQYTPKVKMHVNSNLSNITSSKQCFPTPASSKIKLSLPYQKMSRIPEFESDSDNEENDVNIQENQDLGANEVIHDEEEILNIFQEGQNDNIDDFTPNHIL